MSVESLSFYGRERVVAVCHGYVIAWQEMPHVISQTYGLVITLYSISAVLYSHF